MAGLLASHLPAARRLVGHPTAGLLWVPLATRPTAGLLAAHPLSVRLLAAHLVTARSRRLHAAGHSLLAHALARVLHLLSGPLHLLAHFHPRLGGGLHSLLHRSLHVRHDGLETLQIALHHRLGELLARKPLHHRLRHLEALLLGRLLPLHRAQGHPGHVPLEIDRLLDGLLALIHRRLL
ncbi:hypothetical protein [Haloterrigena turkmenica]|uniref:hypothetical protein n=1 Tax=Haloterrigena turkmenica TaxID=62320 RepID=UPI000677BFF2|nr:hypothetical protein [Haloterrigena turkmenica]